MRNGVNIKCDTLFLHNTFPDDNEKIVRKITRFIPLKNSIRSADNSSTKLPVTDLNKAPQRGADSNLHWYKSSLV